MKSITLNISDQDEKKIVDAYCLIFAYRETIRNPDFDNKEPESVDNPQNIPNPETKGQFTKRMISNHIKKVVFRAEKHLAVQTIEDITIS